MTVFFMFMTDLCWVTRNDFVRFRYFWDRKMSQNCPEIYSAKSLVLKFQFLLLGALLMFVYLRVFGWTTFQKCQFCCLFVALFSFVLLSPRLIRCLCRTWERARCPKGKLRWGWRPPWKRESRIRLLTVSSSLHIIAPEISGTNVTIHHSCCGSFLISMSVRTRGWHGNGESSNTLELPR